MQTAYSDLSELPNPQTCPPAWKTTSFLLEGRLFSQRDVELDGNVRNSTAVLPVIPFLILCRSSRYLSQDNMPVERSSIYIYQSPATIRKHSTRSRHQRLAASYSQDDFLIAAGRKESLLQNLSSRATSLMVGSGRHRHLKQIPEPFMARYPFRRNCKQISLYPPSH